jgi:outer membrane protein assembly factor BamB
MFSRLCHRRLLIVIGLALATSGCWPMPGAGPDRWSYNPFEDVVTAADVAALERSFRVTLPDEAGAPIVTGRGLFVSSKLRVHAFDRVSGAPRWDRLLGYVPPPGDADLAARVGDPFLEGDRVFVVDSAAGPRGSEVHQLSILSATSGDVLEQRSAGALLAKRGTALATGSRFSAIIPEWSQLGVTDPGRRLSWGGMVTRTFSGRATLGTDRLYAAFGATVDSFDYQIPCGPVPEAPQFDFCTPEWSQTLDGESTDVVISEDRTTLFVASAGGTAYALDAATGEVRWTMPLGSSATAAPALADGTLYVATSAGRIVAAAAAGCGKAVCRPLWKASTGSAVAVQPAVAGGVVYAGTLGGTVVAFDAAGCGAGRCRPLWTGEAGEAVDGGLAVALGRLYAGTTTGVVAFAPPAG